MTNTTPTSNEPDEIFNPFSAPEPGKPGAEPPAPDQGPAGAEQPADPDPVGHDPVDVMFQAPDLSKVTPPPTKKPNPQESEKNSDDDADSGQSGQGSGGADTADPESENSSGARRNRRKRRRGGRQKGRSDNGDQQQEGSSAAKPSSDGEQEPQTVAQKDTSAQTSSDDTEQSPSGPDTEDDSKVIRRTRRRRRGSADMEIEESGDQGHTVTRIRSGREAGDNAAGQVTGIKGSTRLEAKRQRRRASREGGRRRGIITEAEFLARRESVDRKMIVRQRGERIQIGVLEDGILAEHYVSHTTADSMIGNVYLGKVQNVLPSMEAAFVDIGRGRNAVLYAGEVDWDAANIGSSPRKIENALKSGDSVLVQVTKDPVGHKGARLTSQVSLPGRYLVYVPGGSMTGISRKLPDTERARLKKILKEQMPSDAGVIVRTAAEGASEEELTNDVNRLRSLWEGIQSQTKDKKVLAPELLYAEPDLTIKVVRDVFNEDFSAMVIQGEDTWDNVEAYVTYVAPHLLDRCQQWKPDEHQAEDIFTHHRIDEQLNKALQRNVNLPSGGSLVFDRTEAMTVVDVNTGKFTGSGGNLEETVTKNNLEAAEELVRQLRLRDIGGIIVIDFIDMVMESNRDLVLRRLVECLGRDRTKHQVAEVTSLGLVQMTRKRMGTGLLEVFSTECEHCAGRGYHTHPEPVEQRPSYTSQADAQSGRSAKKRRGRRRRDEGDRESEQPEFKKLEQASQGMAKVAAASNGGPKTEDSAPNKRESSASDTTAAAEQAVLTIAGEKVEVPRGASHKPSEAKPNRSQKPAAAEPSSLDSLDRALESRSQAPPRKPRRRRAAGSAQGTSGEVTQVSTETSGPEATFSASASEVSSTPKEPTKEPVMLGVGVSAEEISRAQ